MSRTETPTENAGKPIEYDPDFNGPLKRRSCTDILCLLLFIAFIGCWIGVATYAYTNGDKEDLLLPKDSQGRRCGFDDQVQDKPYLFFFDLTKCLPPSVTFKCNTPQVCVKKCPERNLIWNPSLNQIPALTDLICKNNYIPNSKEEADGLISNGTCAQWYLKSKSVVKRCVPKLNDETVQQTIDQLSKLGVYVEEKLEKVDKNFGVLEKTTQITQDLVNDLKNCWKEICIGLVGSILICILYIFIMRWIAKVMVWFSILGTVALLSFGVYITAIYYNYYRNHPYDHENAKNIFEEYVRTKEFWLVLLIITSVILAILLFVLIFLRKRVVLAIALIKEGSKAVSAVTSALFFPIIPWILQMGLIAFSISLALYLSTIGVARHEVRDLKGCKCYDEVASYHDGSECTIELFNKFCGHCTGASCQFIEIANPKIVPYLQAFNVFGFFWSVFFVSAMGQMILAATFATWYWTFKKSNVPFFTITAAAFRTFRYHIGTLAFGSLIIAICRMIRVFLEYLDRKLKKYDNEVTKAIMCCLKCFFWCLENFLKFINKNAYIMCAIHGKNFCTSAKDAFNLLLRNIVRVFVLDKVTDFLFFLSKLLVTLGVSSLVYSYLEFLSKKNLHYPIAPAILVGVCTYLVTCMFFNVYAMAVDTLFLCFLEDCERNDGSRERPYFMSTNLMKILGKRNKSS